LAPFVPLPQWAVRAGLLAGAGAVVLIVVMIVVALNRERGVRLGEWLAHWLPERFRDPFTAAWASLIDGFAVVKEPGQFLRVVLLSMAIWAVSAVVNYCVLVGFARFRTASTTNSRDSGPVRHCPGHGDPFLAGIHWCV